MSDWQPIETAVSDLSTVLVSNGDSVWVAWLDDNGEWIDATDPQEGSLGVMTHWMPLPEPA